MRSYIELCGDDLPKTFTNLDIYLNGMQHSWFTNLNDVPSNILFGVSPNGWTDNSKALAWLERNFGPGSLTEVKAAGAWRMSHVNRNVSRL